MPKYWGKQIFAHGRFPEVGQKQKTERKKEREKKKRANDGNNNGQLCIAKPPCVAHAKPPGPTRLNCSDTVFGVLFNWLWNVQMGQSQCQSRI